MQEPLGEEHTGKRQFLVHIDADLIRQVKILAIERGVTASSLVQQSLVEFMGREKPATPVSGVTETK